MIRRVLRTVVLAPIGALLLLEVLLRGEWKLLGEELKRRGYL